MRGSITKYKGRLDVCIWHIMTSKDGEDQEDAGLCWDFGWDQIEDVKKILDEVYDAGSKNEKINEYEEDPEWEEFHRKRDELEAKWWYKIWSFLCDISISIWPFGWKFVTTKKHFYSMSLRGFQLGPIRISW